VVVWRTFKHAGRLYSFYKDLAERRGTSKAKSGEIVDSYRHLREHGNALSIVVLEIVLGAALIRAGSAVDGAWEGTKLSLLAVLLAVWVLPGALVWLVGSIIELRFSEDRDCPDEPTALWAPRR
jgi:hypothetical protein